MELKKDRPGWKVKLGKLRLLLLAAGPAHTARPSDPVHEAATAREYAPAHCLEMSRLVTAKYPPTAHPDIQRQIFGEPAGGAGPGSRT